MCQEEGFSLQKGMNYRVKSDYSIFLMSVRVGAPYSDEILEDGRVLIYEGHDAPRSKYGPNPKTFDQPMSSQYDKPTENGKFFEAAMSYKKKNLPSEKIKVYEKIRSGIWVYNGVFDLFDAWTEESNGRQVFKFRLEIAESLDDFSSLNISKDDLKHTRMIPSEVKLSVWKRDKGKCRLCSSENNLHFDHIIPFSKGGTSLNAKNIQLLCARHNIAKRDKIQ